MKKLKLNVVIILVMSLLIGCNTANGNIIVNEPDIVEIIEEANVTNVEVVEIDTEVVETDNGGSLFKHLDERLIQADRAVSLIAELSDAKYEGRQAGSDANEAAEDYLVSLYEEIGLAPLETLGGYKQTYNQIAAYPVSPTEITVEGSDLTFEYQIDFTERFSIGHSFYDTDTSAEMIFVRKLDDLKDDIWSFDDKVLLLPQTVYYDSGFWYAIDSMVKEGVNIEAVIVPTEAPEAGMRVARGVRDDGFSEFGEADPVLLNFSMNKFNDLMKLSFDHAVINIKMDYEVIDAEVANIVGMIKGKNETGVNETIIVGAHMDHVGNNMNGTVNSGALDNASGVSVMLELARVILEAGQPEDNIIFVAFNGEEDGLLGSEYFTENPPIEYDILDTKMLNLDMVGSINDVPLMICSTSNYSVPVRAEMAELAEQLGIDYTKEQMGSSDHVNFANAGIRSVMLIHLDYAYYHTYMDTVENAISEDRLKEVIRLSLAFLDKEIYE